MKISNSKKQLAKIISENGGWVATSNLAVYGKTSGRCYLLRTEEWPVYNATIKGFFVNASDVVSEFPAKPFANWHQTILSRDEYFHLYPELDSSLVAMCEGVTEENKHPEYCESVMRSIPEPSYKPTIEQLAADYKAKLEIAQQAQEEADSHRCGAEAALQRLYLAGLEIGLDIAIADDEPEAQEDDPLNITDWRDLRVGDEIECVSVCLEDNGLEMFEDDNRHHGKVCMVIGFEAGGINHINTDIDGGLYIQDFKFIRRP